jgi:hypothetical protein
LRLFGAAFDGMTFYWQSTVSGILPFGNVFVAVIASPRANAYKSLTQFGEFSE